MPGPVRILLTFLAAIIVTASLAIEITSTRVMAQGLTGLCTQSENGVTCLFRYTNASAYATDYRYTQTVQYLADTGWTDIGSDSSAPPYAETSVVGHSPDGRSYNITYLQAVIVGLDPDTGYTLRAKSHYEHLTDPTRNWDLYSTVLSIHTLSVLPEAPEQVSVARNEAGDGTTVTWVAPDSVKTLTKFIIQRAELQRTSGVAVWGKEKFFETADGATLTYTDTGLDPDVTYQYQVAGVSSAGTGFYSATVRTLGAVGENDVAVDDRGYDAIPTPNHGQLPTGYDTSTGDVELVAAVDASITQMIGPTGLTWDPDKMRHFLVVLGAGVLAGMALVGNRKLGNRNNGQSMLLAFLLFQAALWLGALMLGFPWHWAMLPTLMTVGLGLIAFGKKVSA